MSISAITNRMLISEGNYEAGQIDAALTTVRDEVKIIVAEINRRLKRLEETAAEFKAIVEVDVDSLSADDCSQLASRVEPLREAFVNLYNQLPQVRISDEAGAEIGNVWIKTGHVRQALRERGSALRAWTEDEVVRLRREQEAREDAAFIEDLRERVKHGEYIDVDDEIVKRRRRRKDGFPIPAYAYKYVMPPTVVTAEVTAV